MSKGSKNNLKDRTDEAIDWLNSVGDEFANQGMSEHDMADIAIGAVEESFGECFIDRGEVISAARAILDNCE